MGLKIHSFLSTFLVLSVVHYGSAQKKLDVYMGDEAKVILLAYDAIPWDGQNDDGTGVTEIELNEFMTPRLPNIHWTIDATEKESFAKETENINWRTVHRLLKEASAFLEVLPTYTLKEPKLKWKLEQEKGKGQKIIIFAGCGKNGYTAAEIGLQLHKQDFNVIVVGYPSRDGTRTRSKEWVYLRKKLMKQHLDYTETPTENSFQYIEIYEKNIESNQFKDLKIPKGNYLYLDGHIGVRERDEEDSNKYPLATINFLSEIKKVLTWSTIISIDTAVHLDAKFGIYRYDKDNNPLPSILPHGTILINFVPPCVLTPSLTIELDNLTNKMVSKGEADDILQMKFVSFAVVTVDDLYDFMDNKNNSSKIETKWNELTSNTKPCPQHILKGRPNYSQVLTPVGKTTVGDFYYMEDLSKYIAIPTPDLQGPLEW